MATHTLSPSHLCQPAWWRRSSPPIAVRFGQNRIAYCDHCGVYFTEDPHYGRTRLTWQPTYRCGCLSHIKLDALQAAVAPAVRRADPPLSFHGSYLALASHRRERGR